MLAGKQFHSLGATYLKDLAANVVCFTVGMLSKTPMLLDLMFARFCALTEIRSCKYLGAELLMHLWVSSRILNSICCCMGSQCSVFRDSVELSYFDLPSANFAHMFWIL